MTERIRSNSTIAQNVKSEIAALIKDGCVLSIKDLDEIAAKHGASSGTFIINHLTRTFGTRLGSSENHQDVYYDIAGVATTKTRYKRHILIVSSSLPPDQTEWEEVTVAIDTKLRQAGVKAGQTWQAHGGQVSRPRGGPWRQTQ